MVVKGLTGRGLSRGLRDCLVVSEGPETEGVPDRLRYGRMKLLQFKENYRPAYWGTWNKRSAHISSRCPLRQDKVLHPSHSYLSAPVAPSCLGRDRFSVGVS